MMFSVCVVHLYKSTCNRTNGQRHRRRPENNDTASEQLTGHRNGRNIPITNACKGDKTPPDGLWYRVELFVGGFFNVVHH